jgi:GntR family transcriptional repressor for pyruvate dehydrogenase complex
VADSGVKWAEVTRVEIRPIRRATIYEAIVAQLQEFILHGDLRPGDRLPAERDLARRFGVSRISVRQALAVLHSMGLIETRPGGGTFAASGQGRGSFAVAAALAAGRDMTHAQMEVRLIVEPPAAALAARHATQDDLAEMARALGAQAEGIPTPELGLEGDSRFHAAIARATKNPLLVQMIEVITDALMPSRQASARAPGGAQQALREHQRILQAIERRDSAGAARAMRTHLLTVERLALGSASAASAGPTRGGHGRP